MRELITPEVCEWMMSTDSIDQSLPDLLARPDWMKRAQCRGEDVALFFPERGASSATAKAICNGCPVRSECLDYATAGGVVEGIWAERRAGDGGSCEGWLRADRSARVLLGSYSKLT